VTGVVLVGRIPPVSKEELEKVQAVIAEGVAREGLQDVIVPPEQAAEAAGPGQFGYPTTAAARCMTRSCTTPKTRPGTGCRSWPAMGRRPDDRGRAGGRRLAAGGPGRAADEDHQLAKQVVGLDSGLVIRWRSWHRWSALCLLACIYLAIAVALDRDAHAGLETGLIPVTIPEMLSMLRGTPSRRLAGTMPTVSTGRNGAAATSTEPAKPPALECLRRCRAVITTDYSCRNCRVGSWRGGISPA